jgi:hypothetical protein
VATDLGTRRARTPALIARRFHLHTAQLAGSPSICMSASSSRPIGWILDPMSHRPTPEEVSAMQSQLLGSYAVILLVSSQLPALLFQADWGAESRRRVGDLSPFWRGLARLSIPADNLLHPFNTYAFRFLVQPFIEAHINQRLSQLDRAYLYLTHATLDPPLLPADRLVDARAQVQDLNETLKPWTSVRSLLRFVGPPVVGILVTALGSANIYEGIAGAGGEELFLLWLVVFFTAFYAAAFGSGAFHYKRSLFLAPGNTYQAEERLWAALGLQRRPEPAIDEILHGLASLAFAVFFAVGAASSAAGLGWKLVFGVAACGFLAVGPVYLKSAKMREPR